MQDPIWEDQRPGDTLCISECTVLHARVKFITRGLSISQQSVLSLCACVSICKKAYYVGLPGWLRGKESACQCRRHGFGSWSRKIPHAMEQLSACTTTREPVL